LVILKAILDLTEVVWEFLDNGCNKKQHMAEQQNYSS
jgi:hypothetical protein